MTFVSIALLPIVWLLLSKYVFRPLEGWISSRMPGKLAEALTKKRW